MLEVWSVADMQPENGSARKGKSIGTMRREIERTTEEFIAYSGSAGCGLCEGAVNRAQISRQRPHAYPGRQRCENGPLEVFRHRTAHRSRHGVSVW